jgi:hypothetical protein
MLGGPGALRLIEDQIDVTAHTDRFLANAEFELRAVGSSVGVGLELGIGVAVIARHLAVGTLESWNRGDHSGIQQWDAGVI